MKTWIATSLFVGSVALAFVLGFAWQDGYGRFISWLIVATGVTVLTVFIPPKSATTTNAILIDERNRFSQPALITLGWFVTIVSAYLACAIWNVAIWTPSSTTPLPINIDIPPTLWVLAGVIGVDVIGTGVILSVKRRQAPTATHLAEATRLRMPSPAPAGTLFVRPDPTQAEPSDLATYDELSMQETPDLAAIQKLLFQITAVIVYAVVLGRLIFLTPAATAITAFPAIPEGFLALLGISTAAALANRSIPR